jgi:imidazoleglycerol phosphate dehydratase HisB
MLVLFARHGAFGLTVSARRSRRDQHAPSKTWALALGGAMSKALGTRKGSTAPDIS